MGASHTLIVPLRNFDTRTGAVYVACTNDSFWKKLVGALDIAEIGADPRFATNALRVANRGELEPMLEKIFAGQTRETLLDKLVAAGVPCAAVKKVSEMVADPHQQARGSVLKMDYPGIGKVVTARNPLRLSDAPFEIHRLAPRLGEHTRELMHDVGYSDDDIAALAKANAIKIHEGETP